MTDRHLRDTVASCPRRWIRWSGRPTTFALRMEGDPLLRSTIESAIPYANVIAGVLNLLPRSVTGGLLKHVDFLASDVPGFPERVIVGGAEVLGCYPFGPTIGAGANVTLMSYAGTCNIGVTTDVAAVANPERFNECLVEGFEEVLALERHPGRHPGPAERMRSLRGRVAVAAVGALLRRRVLEQPGRGRVGGAGTGGRARRPRSRQEAGAPPVTSVTWPGCAAPMRAAAPSPTPDPEEVQGITEDTITVGTVADPGFNPQTRPRPGNIRRGRGLRRVVQRRGWHQRQAAGTEPP